MSRAGLALGWVGRSQGCGEQAGRECADRGKVTIGAHCRGQQAACTLPHPSDPRRARLAAAAAGRGPS